MLPTLLSIILSTAMAFVPGSICDGTGPDNVSSIMLSGRHMTVVGIEWSPFLTSKADPMATNDDWPIGAADHGGWQGFDVELLDALARILGFTYTIESHSKPKTETWQAFLLRTSELGDLVSTYWVQTPERQDNFLVPYGHIDFSTTLVTRKAMQKEPSVWKKTLTVFEPFDIYVWVALIFVVIISAGIDHWLERQPEGGGERFGESMYEFTAGVLWGGFGSPKTATSAWYQIAFGALVVIITSAYTANLAAFLTVSAITIEPMEMQDIMSSGVQVCIREDDLLGGQYQKLYSTVRFKSYPNGALGELLENRTCHAVFLPRISFQLAARKDPIYACKLKTTPTIPATGSYVTNRLRCAPSLSP